MKTLVAIVERGKGKNNFSCFCPELLAGNLLAGYGKNAREAMEDIQEAYNEVKKFEAEKGNTVPEISFNWRFDVGAFFDYYPLDVSATAKFIGVSPSILRQYVAALRVPKEKQLAKIKDGIQRLAEALNCPALIDAPVTSYVGRKSE